MLNLEIYDTAKIEPLPLEDLPNTACLILAGGQGSRLGLPLPKALVPVSPIKGKSLLQLFCEKTVAASHCHNKPLFLAIMTSPLNHEAICSYLETHHYFGLSKELVDCFPQEMLPFLDDRGDFVLEAPGKIWSGPDGNGHSLKLLFRKGIWDKWKKRGVEFVNVIPIDNPLADPFDTQLVNYHQKQGSDITIKAILRNDPQEKLGVIGWKNHKICIQEYSELTLDSSQFKLGNIGLFCMNLDFIKTVAPISLPLHIARKTALVLRESSEGYVRENTSIQKFETFIFDILNYAKKTTVLVYPREEVYAPLKNGSGDKSLATLQTALLAADRRAFERLTGLPPPNHPFELDQAFHYPNASLLQKWRGKPLPHHNHIEL